MHLLKQCFILINKIYQRLRLNMVTLKQISEESGFSIRTVSIALNGDPVAGRISEERVADIQKIARKRGYKVSAAARAIRLKKTLQVGVLVRNDPDTPMVDLSAYETILGINHRMEQRGYIVSLIRYTDIANEFASQSRVFTESVLDGMIGIGNIPIAHCSTINHAIKTCVWVDNSTVNLQNRIFRDEYQAGYLAADHVCRLGYKTIYWLGPLPEESDVHISVSQRYAGMFDRLTQEGIKPRIRLLPNWNPEVQYNELAQTFKPEHAVIAYNNDLALHVSKLATSMGYCEGPFGYGLVCCEDSGYIHDSWKGLSRVSFDRYLMGKKAADLMLALLENKPAKTNTEYQMPVHWIPGNTAWGPPQNRIR